MECNPLLMIEKDVAIALQKATLRLELRDGDLYACCVRGDRRSVAVPTQDDWPEMLRRAGARAQLTTTVHLIRRQELLHVYNTGHWVGKMTVPAFAAALRDLGDARALAFYLEK